MEDAFDACLEKHAIEAKWNEIWKESWIGNRINVNINILIYFHSQFRGGYWTIILGRPTSFGGLGDGGMECRVFLLSVLNSVLRYMVFYDDANFPVIFIDFVTWSYSQRLFPSKELIATKLLQRHVRMFLFVIVDQNFRKAQASFYPVFVIGN